LLPDRRDIGKFYLYVNEIHNKRVQRLPIEMLHQERKFKKQHYRKERRLLTSRTN